MNKTEQQEAKRFAQMVIATSKLRWEHICGSIFRSPSGSVHDLSAADLSKLPQIEKNNSFAVAKLIS